MSRQSSAPSVTQQKLICVIFWGIIFGFVLIKRPNISRPCWISTLWKDHVQECCCTILRMKVVFLTMRWRDCIRGGKIGNGEAKSTQAGTDTLSYQRFAVKLCLRVKSCRMWLGSKRTSKIKSCNSASFNLANFYAEQQENGVPTAGVGTRSPASLLLSQEV